jgi:hypothetical protein
MGFGGKYDHSPIFIEIFGGPSKPTNPFKFNLEWLLDEIFQNLVKATWVPGDEGSNTPRVVQFVVNLKWVKKITIDWAREKGKREEYELKYVEAQIELITQSDGEGYLSEASRVSLRELEVRRRKLLDEKEALWRQKIRAIWLGKGDENTKFFHAYAMGRKAMNIIWHLQDNQRAEISYFDGLANFGKTHFQSLFKAREGSNLVDIVRMALFFPRFVDDEDNRDLYAEVFEDELKWILHTFQKDKSHRPDGWRIEFYLGFFDVLGKDLLVVVEEYWRVGNIHAPFNSTFISLIPK